MFFRSLMAATSLNLMCPLQPQSFRVTNLLIGFPPVPMPFPTGHLCITLHMYARAKGNKKVELFSTYECRLIIT